MSSENWERVSKGEPCEVCGKPDWCTRNENGSCCMRVQSDKPMHNSGWFHRNGTELKKVNYLKPEAPRREINATQIMRGFASTPHHDLELRFAESLGVTIQSLIALGCAWAVGYEAWAFPMMDGWGSTVGIRLRSEDGKKWAVKGSRQGIFIPQIAPQEVVYIVEGPTDCAAAVSLGLFVLGRPSCMCGNEDIKIALKRLDCRRAVVISDNDGPGVNGALKLSTELPVSNCVMIPPAKDLREFLNFGGTKNVMESIVKGLVWRK